MQQVDIAIAQAQITQLLQSALESEVVWSFLRCQFGQL